MIVEKQALALLEEVVEAYGPDTTYDSRCREAGLAAGSGCVYVTPAGEVAPLCLIGVVLVEKCGVDPARFRDKIPFDAGRVYGDTLNTKSIRMLDRYAPEITGKFNGRARAILGEAQSAQDSGRNWGQALDAAKAYYDACQPSAVLAGL